MCDILKEVYRKVYDESFDYNDFEKRIKMQKAVYLLENMGIHVGDYSFSWNKYGPYSLGLDGDAKRCSERVNEKEVAFSEIAKNGFEQIQTYIKKREHYSCVEWVECIASVHYLKNIFRIKPSKLYKELVARKPYLDNRLAFESALEIVYDIEK